MARRQHLSSVVVAAVVVFLFLTYYMSMSPASYPTRLSESDVEPSKSKGLQADLAVADSIWKGGSIAPKLENATAKAELGRATWKFLHTMMARFPEKPTADESAALKTFMHLFSHLYPCGECAAHFRKLLEKYPPQTSGRQAAAGWACHVHNQVNKRLRKPEFDCNNIGDFYDCGCGEEDKDKKKKDGDAKDGDKGLHELKEREVLSLEKEGLSRGG